MSGLKKYFLILISILFSTQLFAENEGYFNIQNGSEYLGFSNMSKEFGITSLMNSAMENDAKATKIFLNSGSYVNEKNIAKATPLHLAARNYAVDAAKVLIENGAEINAKDNEGWTPLMRASLNGDLEMIKLLVENNAKIWVKNNYGETAFLHVVMANCYECAEFLLDSTKTKNSLVRDQIRESLDIARKRYNEPLIELLEGQLSKGEILVLTTPEEKPIEVESESKTEVLSQEKITKIIYNFMGKTISKEEYEKLKANNFYKLDNNANKTITNIKQENEINILKEEKNVKSDFEEKPVIKEEKIDIKEEIKPVIKEEIKPETKEENKKTYKFNSIKQENIVDNKETEKEIKEEVKPVIEKEKPVIKEENNKQKTFNFNGKKVNKVEETVEEEVKPTIKEESKKTYKFNSIKQEESTKQSVIEEPKNNDTKKYKLNSEDKKPIIMKETSSKNLNKNVVIDEEEVKEIQPKMKLINEGDKVNPKLIYNLKNPDAK